MRGTRIALILAGLLLFQFVLGVAFRASVYADMYIAPDEPYGIADVIEFMLGWVLLALGFVAVVVSITLAVRGPRCNRVAAGWLGALVLLLGVLVGPAHTAAARWGRAKWTALSYGAVPVSRAEYSGECGPHRVLVGWSEVSELAAHQPCRLG